MGRSWKFSKALFFLLPASALLAIPVTRDRFTPIYTLKDDRSTSVINDNFRRVTTFQIEDMGSNVAGEPVLLLNQVTFSKAQPDTAYSVMVALSWSATYRVLQKSTTGFVLSVNIGAYPAPENTFDWILVR